MVSHKKGYFPKSSGVVKRTPFYDEKNCKKISHERVNKISPD